MPGQSAISLLRCTDDTIALILHRGKRATRIYLTLDQAQHLSNRLQSYAKGNYGLERVINQEPTT